MECIVTVDKAQGTGRVDGRTSAAADRWVREELRGLEPASSLLKAEADGTGFIGGI